MELGYDEAGSGPVLLLVHGFPLDRTFWSGQLDGLSDSRRVVAVDLRGRGKSPADAASGWSIDDLADDVAETIDALGTGPVDVAGLSMGGYVLFSLWRRHKQKVRSLILIDTKAEADSEEAKEGREKTAALAREKGSGALFVVLEPKVLAPSTGSDVRERVRSTFESVPGETSAADAIAMKNRADSTEDLPGINVPTLVLHGAEDTLIPIDAAKQLVASIPDAKLVTVPDASHFAPMENPGSANEAIREFLG